MRIAIALQPGYMKLVSLRDKDRMHLHDLISASLIETSWRARYSPELAAPFHVFLDDPAG